MIRNSGSFVKIIVILLLLVWVVTSLAALSGMYRLWWQRERQEYLGHPVEYQREVVWKIAGLPEKLLKATRELQYAWPDDVAYTFLGDHDKKSYAEYLLIPRVPSGSDTFILNTNGSFIPLQREIQASTATSQSIAHPASFFLALISLIGLTALIRSLKSFGTFSIPECFSLSCLTLCVAGIVSKVIFMSLTPGFILIVLLGLSGFFLWMKHLFDSSLSNFQVMRPQLSCPGFHCSKGALFWLGSVCLLVIALGCSWIMLMSVIVVPDDWDAWAIWGAKAKILLLGDNGLVEATYFGHPDYPLLWPMVWSFSAWFSGGWEEMWSRGWGGVFAFLCAIEIIVILRRLINNNLTAILGGALFLSMPITLVVASWSYAEAPFWLLTISCAGCLLLKGSDSPIFVTIIAGLLASGAAYTKNEGVLFALVSAVWILVLPGQRKYFHFLIFIGVFLVCYLPWIYWVRFQLGLGSHATAGLFFNVENLQHGLNRILPALKSISRIWGDIKLWNIVLWGALLSAVISIGNPLYRKLLFLPLAMIAGYFFITIFHRADIYWQVGTSWNRLTLHIMPFLIVISLSFLHDQLSRSSRNTCSTSQDF